MLGVTSRNNEGIRLPLFDYTSKVILSIKDYEDRIEKEIARVRNLKKEGLPWFIKGVRKKGKISFDDPTSRIKNLRKEKQRELAGIGIKTVGHFLKTARAYRRV